MKNIRKFSGQLIIAALIISMLAFAAPVQAAYSTGFSNGTIQVTSINNSGMTVSGSVLIEGRAAVDRVYVCIRGPQKEVIAQPIDVSGGTFSSNVNLRFGPGLYTLWMGDNATRFDGSIRFEVINSQEQDNRYLDPSAYVDSDNPTVMAYAAAIVGNAQSDYEKLQAIHSWVTSNIKYDYDAYLNGYDMMLTASQTLEDRSGICRNYAFLTAALCRAAGLPARVVYGDASTNGDWDTQKHAWNEVYINGNWVNVDSTWDAGYIRNATFVTRPTTTYFNPDAADFAQTHSGATVTLH